MFADTNIMIDGTEEEATAYYHKWVADVKAHVPPERLLIFEAKDGWAPLCKFLGVPEPDEPYPRTNDTQQMLDMIKVSNNCSNKLISLSYFQNAKNSLFHRKPRESSSSASTSFQPWRWQQLLFTTTLNEQNSKNIKK